MSQSEKDDRILLEGMVFNGRIGCLESEKSTLQPYVVDIVFFCRRLGAVLTDRLEETIDYSNAFMAVKSLVETADCSTIERLAGIIADRLLKQFTLAQAVEVTVRKPHAPIDGEFSAMAVRLFRQRSDLI